MYVTQPQHSTQVASGLEADPIKWDESNAGVEYKTDWATAVRYKVNDIVKYGGSLYICTTYPPQLHLQVTQLIGLNLLKESHLKMYGSYGTYTPKRRHCKIWWIPNTLH